MSWHVTCLCDVDVATSLFIPSNPHHWTWFPEIFHTPAAGTVAAVWGGPSSSSLSFLLCPITCLDGQQNLSSWNMQSPFSHWTWHVQHFNWFNSVTYVTCVTIKTNKTISNETQIKIINIIKSDKIMQQTYITHCPAYHGTTCFTLFYRYIQYDCISIISHISYTWQKTFIPDCTHKNIQLDAWRSWGFMKALANIANIEYIWILLQIHTLHDPHVWICEWCKCQHPQTR